MNSAIIFIKNPQKGKVKTRLAADIGDNAAMEVYLELTRLTREAMMQVDCDRHVYYSTFVDDDDAWPLTHFHKHIQRGEDLGERMSHAFGKCFDHGASRVVIIGSDCAELTAAHVQRAFDALDAHDFVIGPANDGGYYLLGMKEYHPEVFEEITWSTHSVFADTLKNIQDLAMSVEVLEQLIDVDYLSDLEEVKHLLNLSDLH